MSKEVMNYGYSVTDEDGDILAVQNTKDGGLALVAKCPAKDQAQGAVMYPETARRFVAALLAILDGDPPEPNPDPPFKLPPSFPFDTWTGKGMAYAHVILSATSKNGAVISVSNTRVSPGVRLDFVQASQFVEACLALLNGEDPQEVKRYGKFPD
jgi:hypothetical protein